MLSHLCANVHFGERIQQPPSLGSYGGPKEHTEETETEIGTSAAPYCQNQLAGTARQWQSALVEIGQLIVKTPGTCGGRARLAGKRIPVSSVYRWFLQGCAAEDILEKFDGVILAEIYAAISYALANPKEIGAEIEREDRISPQPLHSRTAEQVRS